ncbi:hypothetical protein MMC32_004624 [Xylographa parallela]|nr:hypothetical protein [Xylographa parallela]
MEISYGRSNAPICHGAGIKQQTLSDLMKKTEYVDANGVPRVSNEQDRRYFSATGWCLGLIGVFTDLTLPLEVTQLCSVMVNVTRANPPLQDMKLEDIILVLRKKLGPREMAAAQADSGRRALNDCYAEWIWFPCHEKVWIGTWDRTDIPKDAESYPGGWGTILQFVETISMQVLQDTPIYREVGM